MKRPQPHASNFIMARALVIIAAVLALVGGITYAALQSQRAKLTGNTIQTAIAALQVSLDGTNFADSQNGFSFAGLIPGGPAMPSSGHQVTLKNTGNAGLALRISAGGSPTNANGADFTKIRLVVTPIGGGTAQQFTLQQLLDADATGGLAITSPDMLMPSFTAAYKLQIAMDADAVNTASATIGNLEIKFGGRS